MWCTGLHYIYIHVLGVVSVDKVHTGSRSGVYTRMMVEIKINVQQITFLKFNNYSDNTRYSKRSLIIFAPSFVFHRPLRKGGHPKQIILTLVTTISITSIPTSIPTL
jgi:hypothetical protein